MLVIGFVVDAVMVHRGDACFGKNSIYLKRFSRESYSDINTNRSTIVIELDWLTLNMLSFLNAKRLTLPKPLFQLYQQ